MAAVLLDPPVRRWYCPNCGRDHRTRGGRPSQVELHRCPRLRGTWVPFLEEGIRGRLELVERGDYVGDDMVQTDGEGRPVMAVVTHRDHGQDARVLMPCATNVPANQKR